MKYLIFKYFYLIAARIWQHFPPQPADTIVPSNPCSVCHLSQQINCRSILDFLHITYNQP